MNQFKIFQQALEETYPSLTVFSDLDWNLVSNEYLTSHDERPTDVTEFVINFPQYLQDKANDGDSPGYLFELAFYELIQAQLETFEIDYPETKGFHLNPTLSFLNLEYDIHLMMSEAAQGNIQLIERPHILCLFRHPRLGPHNTDITTPILEILRKLEAGALTDLKSLTQDQQKTLHELVELGLVLEIN